MYLFTSGNRAEGSGVRAGKGEGRRETSGFLSCAGSAPWARPPSLWLISGTELSAEGALSHLRAPATETRLRLAEPTPRGRGRGELRAAAGGAEQRAWSRTPAPAGAGSANCSLRAYRPPPAF